MIFGYKLTDRSNSEGSQEKTVSNALNTELKYNILQSTSIQAKFTYSNITFHSIGNVINLNSPAAYIMLDGCYPVRTFCGHSTLPNAWPTILN